MLYRIRFKPLAPFTTQLEAYTLFGAFCWGYYLLKGEKALKNLLSAFEAGSPPFLISSPILEKDNKLFYPMPQIENNFPEIQKSDKEGIYLYNIQKKLKKLKFLPEELFKEFLEGRFKTKGELLKKRNIEEFIEREEGIKIRSQNTLHNFINRITGTTSPGGQLYNLTTYFYPCFTTFLKIYDTSLDVELFKKIFEMVSLGGKKSSGLGRVKVLEIKEAPSYIKEHFEGDFNTNKFVTLASTSIDKAFNLEESFYELKILLGRVENYFVRLTQPILKRRIAVFMPGSVIALKNGKKNFYGGLKKGLEWITGREEDIKIYYYAYAFPLYIKN